MVIRTKIQYREGRFYRVEGNKEWYGKDMEREFPVLTVE